MLKCSTRRREITRLKGYAKSGSGCKSIYTMFNERHNGGRGRGTTHIGAEEGGATNGITNGWRPCDNGG